MMDRVDRRLTCEDTEHEGERQDEHARLASLPNGRSAGRVKRSTHVHALDVVAAVGLSPLDAGGGGAERVSASRAASVEDVSRSTGASSAIRIPRWASATVPQHSVRTRKIPHEIGTAAAGDRCCRLAKRRTSITVDHTALTCQTGRITEMGDCESLGAGGMRRLLEPLQ